MRKLSVLVNDFLNIFQTLSKLQRKVFKYLHWFSKKWRNVFPCIKRMAEALECSESSIKRATSYFHKLGWICKVKRSYRSNLYFMDDGLIRLNIEDKNIFLKDPVNAPQNDLVLTAPIKEKNISTSSEVQVYKNPQKVAQKNRNIPEFVQIPEISRTDQQRLANAFNEYELVKAVEEYRWYKSKGNKIMSAIGVIWSAAKRFSCM